jgi:hypothetical protein
MVTLPLGGRHHHPRQVVLVKRLDEWDCYERLRGPCGLSHYMVEVVVKEYMRTPRWERVLWKTKRLFLDEMAEDVEALAAMCVRDDPKAAARALLSLVWRDRKEDPAACYTVVRAAASLISRSMEWDNLDRAVLSKGLNPLRRWERAKALDRWKNGGLRTYLTLNGCLSPRRL